MIYTFYSFKGGVGRSMALANIAELFYRRGLRVLIVDFDLEAPGLERYFNVPNAQFTTNEILSKRGVIDLLVSYKELCSLPEMIESDEVQKNKKNDRLIVEPLANFCVPIYEKNLNGGDLFLLPAGLRHGNAFKEYVDNVQSFDWQDFYANWEGEKFFDWFREAAESFADVVLIDSRTGITEVGGICTHQLADVVLMFVGANQQNLDGTLKMATSLSKKDLIESGRKGRKLSLLPIPSRIDSFEAESLDEFARSFKSTLGQFFPEGLNLEANLFTELKIPYLPYYAYQERVAVRETDRDSATDLVKAFERITSLLTSLSPKSSYLNQRINLLLSLSKGNKYNINYDHFSAGMLVEAESQDFISKPLYTVLFIGTNPKDTGRLRLDQELRDIQEGLQRAQRSNQFKWQQRLAVRPRDIQSAILDVQPQIIHFSGHGQVENGLVLEDEAGSSKLVNHFALASLFELFADQVQCVILDACYSGLQAHAINQHIPYVIGIDKEIENSAATTFAIGFYDALGTGQDIEFAFKLGYTALQMEGLSEHMVPSLLKKYITKKTVTQISSEHSKQNRVEVFCLYVHEDEKTRNELGKHLSVLEQQGVIKIWHDQRIIAGEAWKNSTNEYLESASIILLLISPDFMDSDYCYGTEMTRAIERHNEGTARVIPIILRPCDWQGSPFSKLQVLPKEGKPVTLWVDRDSAFLDVVQGIRRAVESLAKK
jgi:hypothetical protein